eukprot:569119-Pleurochrysis_carterae.AAC.1
MLENQDKREILPLGKTAMEARRRADTSHQLDTSPPENPRGWIPWGNTVISLGIPHGNNTNFNEFLKNKYAVAKAKLAKARSIQLMTIVGRQKILNANFYGSLRYYMFSMDFPPWLNAAIEQDAYVFTWKGNPKLDPQTMGSRERAGKFISKKATNLPISGGGAGALNWKAHTHAFQAMWAVSFLHPRMHPWKKILTEWLRYPPSIIVNATGKEKKRILEHIPR